MNCIEKRSCSSVWVLSLACAVVLLCSIPAAFAQQSEIVRSKAVGRLFFSQDDRSIMEAVRQGVVDRSVSDGDFEDIQTTSIEVPRIVFKQIVSVIKDSTGNITRESDFTYNGLIRMRGGETKLLSGNTILDEEVIADMGNNAGLSVVELPESSELEVEDRLFGKRYLVRRGDTVSTDGALVNRRNNDKRRFFVVKKTK